MNSVTDRATQTERETDRRTYTGIEEGQCKILWDIIGKHIEELTVQ